MRPGRILAGALAAIAAADAIVLAGAMWLAVAAAARDPGDLPATATLLGVGAFALLAGVLAGAWSYLDRRWVGPLAVLSRQARTVVHSKSERGIEIAPDHALGPLPETVGELARQVIDCRHQVVKAMAAAGARMEEEKSRLEAVLRDVEEAVLVCNPEHRILLYNPTAARILGAPVELGLGRLLWNLVTREPVLHALERLERRLQDGDATDDGEGGIPFVCATADARTMLQGRVSPILDSRDELGGYVLTLSDVGSQMHQLAARDRLLRATTEGLRAPVANLLAASETLASHPQLRGEARAAFERVLANETARLSEHLERLASACSKLPAAGWSTFDVYSTDLLGCVVRRVEGRSALKVTPVGLPLWLHGDSHSLTVAIAHLVERIHALTGTRAIELEPLLGDRHVYLDLVWDGEVIPSRTLDEWLEDRLDGVPGGAALREVLEHHDSELWSQRHRHGGAALRMPLPLPARPRFELPRRNLPPRPVFYDFDLMGQRSSGELENRPLTELSYVVFDTETTGLQPSAGDEILSIAGVRIVNRRILAAETFERLVNPQRPIPRSSIRFHGITEDMVRDQPPLRVVLPQFKSFVGRSVLVGYNAAFDMKFIRLKEKACGVHFDNAVLDTLLLSVFLHRDAPDQTLDGIAARFGIDQVNRHTALGDALTTAAIFVHLIDLLAASGIATLAEALRASSTMVDILKQQAQF